MAPDPGQGTMYATSTDAKGTFRIEGVPAGSYRVEFRRVGLGTVRKEGVVLKPPFRGVVEVTMVPSSSLPSAGALPSPAPGQSEATPEGRGGDAREFSLSGTAVDVDGKPLSDVRIRITRADGSADPIQGLTGADGSYRIDGLTEGEWELESLGLAYLPLRVSLLLSADAQLRLVLVRQPTIYEPPPLDLMPAEEPIPPPAS